MGGGGEEIHVVVVTVVGFAQIMLIFMWCIAKSKLAGGGGFITVEEVLSLSLQRNLGSVLFLNDDVLFFD